MLKIMSDGDTPVKFNAESLNEVVINKHIVDPKGKCNTNKMVGASYRINILGGKGQISIMPTVLQRHTNLLRKFVNPMTVSRSTLPRVIQIRILHQLHHQT